MTKPRALLAGSLLALLAMPVQADTLCFSPVNKRKGDIASDRPWWKPFNYRVQVDDGPIVKPETDSSTSYNFNSGRPLVKIYLGNDVVESFHVSADQLSSGRNCIYFNNLYETWSIAEPWQVEKLCSCDIEESTSNCPKWAADNETCPVVGPYEDVWHEFYYEGTSEAHLVGILVHAGPKMVPSIIEVMADRKMFARIYAITALGLIKEKQALGPLSDLLNDETEEEYFRAAALKAIFVIDSGAGQIAASDIMNNPVLPDGKLRQTAVTVLENPERIPQEWKRH